MAAPKTKKHSKKQQSNGTGNHQQPAGKGNNLQGEVAEFASSLGLASGGSQQGFDDSDFRPEKAQKRFKVDTAKGTRQQSHGKRPQQNASRPPAEQALGQSPHAPRSLGSRQKQGNWAGKGAAEATGAPPKPRTSREEQNLDSVKGRTWNTGVGPRPGEKRKASLLSRTEPSLWYEAAAGLPSLPAEAVAAARAAELTEPELKARKAVAERALENEAVVFEQELGRKNGQDARWLQQVRRSGTTADKVAALTLLVQESAVANLKALDSLLGWVQKRKGGKDVVRQAIDALREIFVVALLPDRKLRFFEQQPLAAVPAAPQGKEGPRRLLYWLVEDGIKKRYSSFVTALDECSRDNLEFLRERAVKAIYELLRNKAEQESQLLRALVNKLGDPSRKVASNAGFLLASLLQEHPAMKAVVATEVERFVFRPGLKDRAQYYAVIFLNQMVLSHKDSEGGSVLANRLIDIYFTLFKMILEGHAGHAAAAAKSQEEAAAAQPKKNRHRDAPQQGRRGKGKQRGKQAGGRPQKGKAEAPKATAEELDARILGAIIAGVRRAFPFVAADDVEPLVQRHSDALFRMVHTASFGVAVQALLLLFQLMSAQNSVSDRFYRALYQTLLSSEVARSNKAPMFMSLLFKAMKADVSARRKAAFAKRVLQVSLEQTPAFACGCLLILSELLKEQPSLWSAIQEAEEASDELEHFEDQPELQEPGMASDAVTGGKGPTQKDAAALPAAAAGGGEVEPLQEQSPAAAGARPVQAAGYDMRKREPLYAGAEKSAWWELCCLAQHMHPSCGAMACQLLAGTHTDYAGDPLRDHSLVAFLDKFVTRKPKAQQRGSSLMQPAAGRNARQQPSAAAVGSSAFTALAEQDVLPDARFFHKYYSVAAERQQGKPARKRKWDEEDAAEGDVASSDEEAEIDDVLEGEEEEEARGGQGYSYDDLAAAMDGGEELLDDGGPSDEDEGSDVEEEAAAAMALGQDSDEFSVKDDSEEDSEASSDAGPDDNDSEADLNPLDLAPATDSDEGDVDEHGLPMIHGEDDDSESDEEGWVMYQGPSQQPASAPKRRKAQRPAKGTGAFASADDFLDKIDQDWAATPADDDLEAAIEEERPNRSKRKPEHKGISKQKK